MHITTTVPTYPFTDVKVIGMFPPPLEGMVKFAAEIVKLGVAVSACALPEPKASVSSDARHVSALFLCIRDIVTFYMAAVSS